MRRICERRWSLVVLFVLLTLGAVPLQALAANPHAADALAGSSGIVKELEQRSYPSGESPLSVSERRFAPRTIFGGDDRVRLSPTFAPVAWLVAWDASGIPISQCSGTFIGPRVVLTAAHCVFNREFGGWVAAVDVVPGNDGDVSPNGWDSANFARIPQAWLDGEVAGVSNWEWDFAILTLESPDLGNRVGWLEMVSLTSNALSSPNFNPVTIGYPGDKPLGTQWMTAGAAFTGVEDAFLLNELDAYPGQSGSGVFRGSDGKVVGVVSAESPYFNVANRVRGAMIAELLSACADLDCWFAWSEEGDSPPPPPPPPPSGDAFTRTWQRTDKPVADGAVSRTWMWGPAPATQPFAENYSEGPNGQRQVVYYDKSRMEITNPNGDQNSVWYVTNGLLVKELVTGQLQVGDSQFQPKQAAQINVAGDPGDQNGPTYATFATLLDDPALPGGAAITQRVNRQGVVSNDPSLAGYGVTAAYLVDVPGLRHQVASPFWAFMNATGTVWENGVLVSDALFENPFYATGYPIAEAYWATVQVGGTPRDVLMQCFERRCLTYTPGNPDGWAVEAGNVGRHYYEWRYGVAP